MEPQNEHEPRKVWQNKRILTEEAGPSGEPKPLQQQDGEEEWHMQEEPSKIGNPRQELPLYTHSEKIHPVTLIPTGEKGSTPTANVRDFEGLILT